MADTAIDVMNTASGEVGYSRWDDPLPGTKYGRWYAALVGDSYYGASGVPYCAMFVSWVFAQAGASCPGLPGAYCPWIVTAGRNSGQTVSAKNAKYGDVVLFDWHGDGVSDHVGLVEGNNGSYLQTIEGNTSDASAGNGGKVLRRTRAYSTVICVIRPKYTGAQSGDYRPTLAQGDTGQYVTKMQELLRAYGWDVEADGVFGQATDSALREFQRAVGLDADGYCGPNTWAALEDENMAKNMATEVWHVDVESNSVGGSAGGYLKAIDSQVTGDTDYAGVGRPMGWRARLDWTGAKVTELNERMDKMQATLDAILRKLN